MNEIVSSILYLNEKLRGVSFDFAFLGGSVLSLLVNDSTADAFYARTSALQNIYFLKHKAVQMYKRRHLSRNRNLL